MHLRAEVIPKYRELKLDDRKFWRPARQGLAREPVLGLPYIPALRLLQKNAHGATEVATTEWDVKTEGARGRRSLKGPPISQQRDWRTPLKRSATGRDPLADCESRARGSALAAVSSAETPRPQGPRAVRLARPACGRTVRVPGGAAGAPRIRENEVQT